MSIVNKIKSNSVVSSLLVSLGTKVISIPVGLLLSLYTTSKIVQATGSGLYGLIVLISSMSQILVFADLGLAAPIISATAKIKEQVTDEEALEKYYDTLSQAFKKLSFVAFTGFIIAVFFKLFGIWNFIFQQDFDNETQTIISVYLVLFGLCVPLGLGYRIMVGFGVNDVEIYLAIFGQICSLFFVTFVINAHLTIYLLVLSTIISAVITGLLSLVFAKRIAKRNSIEIKYIRLFARHKVNKNLLQGSLSMMVTMFSLAFGLYFIRLQLNWFSTGEQLSEFSLVSQIEAAVFSALSFAGMRLWPIFSKSRMENSKVLGLLKVSLLTFGIISALAAAFLCIFGQKAVEIISKGHINVSQTLIMLFAVFLILNSLQLPLGMLLTEPKELRLQADVCIISAILRLGFGFAMIPKYGAVGAISANIVGAMFVLLFEAYATYRIFKLGNNDFSFYPKLRKRKTANDKLT